MFIFAAKISHDLFFVIDQIFLIFPFFSQIFPMFAMLNVIFDPFLTGKTPFFTLFILSRTSDNSTSLNIGGTNAWAVPTSNFGGPSPHSPLGLLPGIRSCINAHESCAACECFSCMQMTKALLAPYEGRSWAQTNWILLRLWKVRSAVNFSLQ